MDEIIGTWVEFGESLFEVIKAVADDYICREILYLSTNPKLQYGDTVVISKTVLQEGLNE